MSHPVPPRRAVRVTPIALAAATNYLASHRAVAAADQSTVCVRCGWSWPCARYRYALAVRDETPAQRADQAVGQ